MCWYFVLQGIQARRNIMGMFWFQVLLKVELVRDQPSVFVSLPQAHSQPVCLMGRRVRNTKLTVITPQILNHLESKLKIKC
jgi:hypothetical protein